MRKELSDVLPHILKGLKCFSLSDGESAKMHISLLYLHIDFFIFFWSRVKESRAKPFGSSTYPDSENLKTHKSLSAPCAMASDA